MASRHDSALTVSLTHHDPSREQNVLESLLSRQVDGIVLWPTGGGSRYLQRLASAVAMVCVDRPIAGVETDSVFCDNRRGAEQAIEFLIGRGHDRIAFVGDRAELYTQQERLEGYRNALIGHALLPDPRLELQRQQDPERLRKQLTYWQSCPRPPGASFAASSLSLTTLVRALSPADPREVVGFDDVPLADVIRGGISVTVQDIETIGSTAAELLFGRMTNQQRSVSHCRVSPTFIDRSRPGISG